MLQKLFIHHLHDFQVLQLLPNGFVMQVTTVQSQRYALPALTNVRSRDHYFFEDRMIPSCSETLLQKSTSTSRRPIFSYRAFSRFSASSSGAFVSKISVLRARNSRFQFEIICRMDFKTLRQIA